MKHVGILEIDDQLQVLVTHRLLPRLDAQGTEKTRGANPHPNQLPDTTTKLVQIHTSGGIHLAGLGDLGAMRFPKRLLVQAVRCKGRKRLKETRQCVTLRRLHHTPRSHRGVLSPGSGRKAIAAPACPQFMGTAREEWENWSRTGPRLKMRYLDLATKAIRSADLDDLSTLNRTQPGTV